LKAYLNDNKQFILLAFIWLVCGMYFGPLVYVVIPVMLLLMYSKGMHLEILLGFLLILTLSDSRLRVLSFAGNIKNIYILVLSLILLKEKAFLEMPIYKYFIPFFAIAIYCVFLNPNIGLSFQKVLSYILLFVVLPNYFYMLYKMYGVELIRGIVFLFCVIFFLGFVFNFFSFNLTNVIGRYRGLLGNPNGLGLYSFLFILFFSTVNEYYPNLFTRNEKIVIYGLSFFSLLKCGARTSLATTLMFFFFKKSYKMSPFIGFIIFIFTCIIYQYVSANLTEIIVSLGLGDELRVDTLESGSGRTVAWTFAWQQIQENFFIGKGFSYTEYIYLVNYEYLSLLGHQGSAHNAYLTLWLDTGLVGLGLFLIGLIAFFLKLASKSALAFPVLYSVLFSNFYESWLCASLNPFTIQLLFILTVIFINIKQTSIDEALKPSN
jgi:O-antigen ligase